LLAICPTVPERNDVGSDRRERRTSGGGGACIRGCVCKICGGVFGRLGGRFRRRIGSGTGRFRRCLGMARRVPVGGGFFDRVHGSRRRCACLVIGADLLLVQKRRVGLNVSDERRGVRFTNAISEQTGDNERIEDIGEINRQKCTNIRDISKI
jgi:hypothetical protein